MTIHIVIETEYAGSTWCGKIRSGLLESAGKKRLRAVVQTETFTCGDDDVIAVIGTSSTWIEPTVAALRASHNAPVILLSSRPFSLSVTNICPDIESSMRDITAYLRSHGKTHTALYGVNPTSISDSKKLACFGSTEHVYYSFNDLKTCREAFCADIEFYDSVICTNDYAAISLIGALKADSPQRLAEIFIISFSGTLIAERFSPSITSVAEDYAAFGRTAVELAPLLIKNQSISFAQIHIKGQLIVRETTQNRPFTENDRPIAAVPHGTGFYADREIAPLVAAEKLFNFCDETDFAILSLLAAGKTYENAADATFLTVGGVKYRLKRMANAVGAESAKALLELAEKSGMFRS